MSSSASMQVEMTDKETVYTRVFNAPRPMVFKTWIDPKHLCKWWGPQGFTCHCELDARPGGEFRIVMQYEGVDYPMRGVFVEVEEPKRLVMDDVIDAHPAEWYERLKELREGEDSIPQLRRIIDFEDHDGGTKLTLRTQFKSKEDRDAFLKMGMTEGWAQSLDKLEAYLAEERKSA